MLLLFRAREDLIIDICHSFENVGMESSGTFETRGRFLLLVQTCKDMLV